jgi:hypothetical protein
MAKLTKAKEGCFKIDKTECTLKAAALLSCFFQI